MSNWRTGLCIVAALLVASPVVSLRADENTLGNGVQFKFARVKFTDSGRSYRPGWAHDYPTAERNLLTILSELTLIQTTPSSYVIVELDDPQLMNYPLLYFSEPGTWLITDREAENLREYFQRGGFAIFDDFDGPRQWAVFEACMQKVFPERRMQRLTIDQLVFQCFFQIETLDIVAPFDYGYPAEFYGMFDDSGRLQAIVNFNNDIGDYWEWSHESFFPVGPTNEAFKFGINYVVYAFTH